MSSAQPWAFDLDGTLVDALSATDLRPLAREVLERLRSSRTVVILWSAGGADYARRTANRLGFADLVDGFYDKVRGADGKWRLDGIEPHHRPGVCVDDEPRGVPAGVRSIEVSPYLGRNPHDRGLERVLETVAAGT